MKALLLSDYKQLTVTDLDTPYPQPNEVIVKVAACGICGSDVHGYDGASGRRIPPIVMGHEAAGTISELGADVSGFKIGDRVTFDSTVYCGECPFCRRGEVNLCDNRQIVGVSCSEFKRSGAFAEYVAVPARILYRLPDALSFPEAALLEAVAVALHGVRVADIRGGESALVVGAGMIGLLLLQAAHVAGCSPIYVADIDSTRLVLAREMGASETLKLSGDSLSQAILERTGGGGVDVVFEAVGRAETVAAAIDCVRKGGTVALVGNIARDVSLPLQRIVTRQIRLQGSCASAGEYPECIDLMARGAVNVDPFISAVAPLSEGPAWFDRLHRRETGLVKVILKPYMADNTQ